MIATLPDEDLLTAVGCEVRADLLRTAVESVQYVALGRVMARDLTQKHGLTQGQAERILAIECDRLCREIRSL